MSKPTRTTAQQADRGPVRARRVRVRAAGAEPGVELPELAEVRRFELRLQGLCTAARVLPAVTATNAASERVRLIACLERGEPAEPHWQLRPARVPSSAFRLVDELRPATRSLPGGELYRSKLEELELDLLLLDVLGKPALVHPLSARRYGTGATLAPLGTDENVPPGDAPTISLARCARHILDHTPPSHEPRVVPADGEPGSLAELVRELAHSVGLSVTVRIDPRLSAGAATGDRTVFLAPRRFGRLEACRYAIHEVFGHLLCAANGRAQPLRLLDWGTADSFADQEGLALYMEELCGVLDGSRRRTLAGRVLAADLMYAGATFGETASRLHRDEGFTCAEAIAISERAFRGGGVARDVSYLLGWLRVRGAVQRGEASLDEFHAGRVSLHALPQLRVLREQGYVRSPVFRAPVPNLSRNFFSTKSGTIPRKSPPSDAASLIRLELTKK